MTISIVRKPTVSKIDGQDYACFPVYDHSMRLFYARDDAQTELTEVGAAVWSRFEYLHRAGTGIMPISCIEGHVEKCGWVQGLVIGIRMPKTSCDLRTALDQLAEWNITDAFEEGASAYLRQLVQLVA